LTVTSKKNLPKQRAR